MSQPKTKTSIPNETPSISALPAPDPVETLREQLAHAEARLSAGAALLTAAREECAGLQARLEVAEKNPLIFALLHLDSGEVAQDAGKRLSALCEQVTKLDAKGTFALKLGVKPFTNGVVMVASVKVSAPEPEAAEAVFYRKEDGRLSREDPRQGQFKFRGSRPDRSSTEDARPYGDGE